MICKRCNSGSFVKNGFVRCKQRYRCKDCFHNFVEGDLRSEKNIEKQNKAIHLYLEGVGFRGIGRLLGVSNVSALNWIKSAGNIIKENHNNNRDRKKVKVMEFDELWHFVASKKTNAGFGCLWTDQDFVLLTSSLEAEL